MDLKKLNADNSKLDETNDMIKIDFFGNLLLRTPEEFEVLSKYFYMNKIDEDFYSVVASGTGCGG